MAGFSQDFLSGSFTDSIQSMNLKPCLQILHLRDGWVAVIIPREGQNSKRKINKLKILIFVLLAINFTLMMITFLSIIKLTFIRNLDLELNLSQIFFKLF